MKKLLLLSFVTLFILSSCSDESVLTPPENINAKNDPIASAKKELLSLVEQSKINLPYTSSNNSARTISEVGINHAAMVDFDFYNSMIDNAIDPNDYECGPTELRFYSADLRSDWDPYDYLIFNNLGRYIVFDYVYLFENEDGGQYYGPDGEFTNQINRTFKDLLRFWNIPTDILLRDAHGKIFDDVEKVIKLLRVYGYPQATAELLADLLKTIYGSDKYFNYNHPLLSFNAFAATADEFWGTPKKIVMGDGILKAYADLGFGDVAPQAILAHEYGHHVQFAKDVEFLNSPESTRKTELMADAFAAYYLTHKRGSTMNWKRVQLFLEVFFEIGDCSFASNGHHGTPNQRMNAAIFGYNLANDTKVNGVIMTAEEFILLFEAELPSLIAPDAP